MSATVFIIEDDLDTREMLGRFLELEGYQVESAENGKLALERLGSGVHACVILLDLMMPVMDGLQFRAVQMRDPSLADIPVIVISADGKVHQTAASLGVAAYMKKPLDVDGLLDLIARLGPSTG